MKLTLGDVEYQASYLDLYKLSLREARTIKRQTGLTILDWETGLRNLGRLDPDMFIGLLYLLQHRAGEEVNWDALDDLPVETVLTSFNFELTEEDKQDLERAVVAAAEKAVADAGPADAGPDGTAEPHVPADTDTDTDTDTDADADKPGDMPTS